MTAGWGWKENGWWFRWGLEAAEVAACKVVVTSIFSSWINSSRFFICFRSLARRFWNQIFTYKNGKKTIYIMLWFFFLFTIVLLKRWFNLRRYFKFVSTTKNVPIAVPQQMLSVLILPPLELHGQNFVILKPNYFKKQSSSSSFLLT